MKSFSLLWIRYDLSCRSLQNTPDKGGCCKALAAINTNQFVSLLANNKLRTRCSEKYGCQTSLICHNRKAEEANLIIWLLVSDSSCVADTIWSLARLFKETHCLFLFYAVSWIRFGNWTVTNHIFAPVRLWCVCVSMNTYRKKTAKKKPHNNHIFVPVRLWCICVPEHVEKINSTQHAM